MHITDVSSGKLKNAAENVIHLKNWHSLKDLKKKKDELKELYQQFDFHQLVQETYDLIDKIKNSPLDDSIIIKTKCLVEELKLRCSDKDNSFFKSISKMQEILDKKIESHSR